MPGEVVTEPSGSSELTLPMPLSMESDVIPCEVHLKVALSPAWMVSGSAENANCTGRTVMVALALACLPDASVTVAT